MIKNPPRAGEPRERTLPDGTEVKWYGLCGSWGDHYRAGHPADAVAGDDEDVNADEVNIAVEQVDN